MGLGRGPSNDDEGVSVSAGKVHDDEGFFVSADFKCFRKGVWG